ncbi:acetyl-coenzyme A synthetase [Oleiphilus sp. HI0085]|nr:acetyl-coenzyme A synthetase [Oleiphilus sp. HI0069]KZZ32140.1 acetyl-coenzyme A synthetase [Oleiphilus sp. HI0085]
MSLAAQNNYTTSNSTSDFVPNIDKVGYQSLYQMSIEKNEDYWRKEAERLYWDKPFTKVKDVSFAKDDLHISWYEDGELNVCYNCVDRHLETRADQAAIIWEADEPGHSKTITYQDLHREVCQLANGLESLGVGKGDRVVLYMPMIPEASYAMLACARIGAIHSVVFGGFSATALADRLDDCEAKVVITATEGVRGGKSIPLKSSVDDALEISKRNTVKNVLVVETTHNTGSTRHNWDVDYRRLVAEQADKHTAVPVNAEDPLFILYTSGSTGKPKGLQHSSGGYLTYVTSTYYYTFDHKEGDVFWCSADVGWITGHSYIVYGPLANGATTLMYEGVPNYPDMGRFGEVIDQHGVTVFYTAPTAIRTLMAKADEATGSSKRDSLRILGTVGEPINPEVWRWYYTQYGHSKCPVVDTWWQTETGGQMMTPLPYATESKPGSACHPLFGIQAELVDTNSDILQGETSGHLVIMDSWPGQARTIWNDHARFIETYFSTHDNMYFTGDGAKRDADGYFWITGRVDDVLNVSGHRLGTAELESALVSHPDVAEAAVVGYPHDIKGEAIYVYVTPMDGVELAANATELLKQHVRVEMGPVATPELIQWVDALPKTRSGKIMRRILRKIAADDFGNLGDTSTLNDPSVVDVLIEGRLNRTDS